MRKLVFLAATIAGLIGLANWWRSHRRVGTAFMNRTVNPWLERRGLIGGPHSELGLIEHVGRKSGIVRQTAVYPVAIDGGFRMIAPVGDASHWVRNVLAAGRCRLQFGERTVELADAVVETPWDVPGLPLPLRALFDWLGFRYVRLRTVTEIRSEMPAPPRTPEAVAA